MTWVSSGGALRIRDTAPASPVERVMGYFDRDINLPDKVNDIKTGPSFGGGNRNVYNQLGKATLSGNMSFVVTDAVFFYHLMANGETLGADTTSYTFALDTPSAGQNTHTITPTNCPTVAPFELVASLEGCGADPDFQRDFTGAQFFSGSVSSSIDEPIRVDAEFSALDVSTSASTVAPTIETAEPFEFYMLKSDVSVMGETITKMESFNITFSNNSKQKWYFNSADSRTPTELVRGYRNLTFSGNLVPDDYQTGGDAVYHLLDTGTPADVTVTYERATGDELTFTLENCLLESAPHAFRESGDEVSVPVNLFPEQITVTAINADTRYNPA